MKDENDINKKQKIGKAFGLNSNFVLKKSRKMDSSDQEDEHFANSSAEEEEDSDNDSAPHESDEESRVSSEYCFSDGSKIIWLSFSLGQYSLGASLDAIR